MMDIRLENITKKFNNKVLFSNFNLTINTNELLCIAGVSGSGKTTLLNIIGLIESVDSGSIYYDNTLINKTRQKQKLLKHQIGFLFQDFGLVDNETIRENFRYLERISKLPTNQQETIIKESLENVGITNNLNQKVYELSGGEKQRIALAKLLVKDCDLVLADEPTASLDEDNKQMVLGYLKQLHQSGKTVVIVSHDATVIDFCDKVILLYFVSNKCGIIVDILRSVANEYI